MDTQKIMVDGKEVEVYTNIDDDEFEDNTINDTIDLKEIIDKIKNGDKNE